MTDDDLVIRSPMDEAIADLVATMTHDLCHAGVVLYDSRRGTLVSEPGPRGLLAIIDDERTYG